MNVLAQTNVQLLSQVAQAGWPERELLRLRTAYEVAMKAYSGQYRANGKTQIAHHIGVASALQHAGARPVLVIAGAVHSLYNLGDFGTGRTGPHEHKRIRVRSELGADVEELVFSYSNLPWNLESIEQMSEQETPIDGAWIDLIWMRVANEIDEVIDAGRRLSHLSRECAKVNTPRGLAVTIALARSVGASNLAAMLADAAVVGAEFPVPEFLVSTEEHCVLVPPSSFRRRLHIALQDSGLGHQLAERVPGARRAATWVRNKIA